MLIGEFLFQFLKLLKLLTNLLQTLCNYGEPGKVRYKTQGASIRNRPKAAWMKGNHRNPQVIFTGNTRHYLHGCSPACKEKWRAGLSWCSEAVMWGEKNQQVLTDDSPDQKPLHTTERDLRRHGGRGGGFQGICDFN